MPAASSAMDCGSCGVLVNTGTRRGPNDSRPSSSAPCTADAHKQGVLTKSARLSPAAGGGDGTSRLLAEIRALRHVALAPNASLQSVASPAIDKIYKNLQKLVMLH